MINEAREVSGNFVEVQDALNQAEALLQGLGRDLQFLVTPEAGVEVVRRGECVTKAVKDVVTTLAGCDPLLWQAERPEGPVTLGGPYAEQPARCAVTGRLLEEAAPIELYYHGLPISPERALELAPLLTTLRSLVVVSFATLDEIQRAEETLAGVENREPRGLLLHRLVAELVGRLVATASPPPAVVAEG